VTKFKKGDLVYWVEEPEDRGLVTKVSPSGGLVWVQWLSGPKAGRSARHEVYSRILRPLEPLTFP